MPELRIGTCSWKFPSWVGLVYSTPEGAEPPQSALPEDAPLFETLTEGEEGQTAARAAPYLVEYAQRYNTVEVDQWFWSLFGPSSIGLPKPEDVLAYRAAIPEAFRFTVKAPNSVTLTHFYQKGDEPLRPNPHFLSVELFETFLDLLTPLHALLGPIMFQFEYLNQQKMPTQARFQALFGEFVRQIPVGLPYGLEVRNPQYLNRAYFQFLQAFGLIPVLVQGYWMPDIRELYREWHQMLWDHDTIAIRLMGPDRKAIEALAPQGWNRVVLPKDNELPGIASMVEDLLDHGLDVYVNVNNHYEGSSPLTIEKLRALLGD
ncbi:MAG: DUF72 domain-containing protein [Anaerolineae bacterium]